MNNEVISDSGPLLADRNLRRIQVLRIPSLNRVLRLSLKVNGNGIGTEWLTADVWTEQGWVTVHEVMPDEPGTSGDPFGASTYSYGIQEVAKEWTDHLFSVVLTPAIAILQTTLAIPSKSQ